MFANFTGIIINTIRTTVVVVILLTVFACNNKQSKKAENNDFKIEKPATEKSTDNKTRKTGYIELKSYDSIVTEILTSSPRYKQLTKGLNKAVVKNGGQYFEVNLERSPIPNHDKRWNYSRTYDFVVYEMYTDRQLNIARFSFDPDNKQLYEYDAVMNQQIPIVFDKSLLSKYEALYK
jgi:hypothetical protein